MFQNPHGDQAVTATTWLDVAKLALGVLTPLSVALLGWFISERLKRIDFTQWSNQKLVEKRLEVYEKVAPHINTLYCFFGWVGNWRDISPPQVVQAKAELDRSINIYRHLFPSEMYEAYRSLLDAMFRPTDSTGEQQKIRSLVHAASRDRRERSSYKWNESWNSWFASEDEVEPHSIILQKYETMMNSLRDSILVSKSVL